MRYDAPLSADIEAFARAVSHDIRVVHDAADTGAIAAESIAAALTPPGRVACLIVPADFSWSEAGTPGPAITAPRRERPSTAAIAEAARILRCPGAAILLGGSTINDHALTAAGRIAAHTGAAVFADRNAARIASGRGRFHPRTVPYFPEPAIAMLSQVRQIIIIETQPPVSFFGYPSTPSYLLPTDAAVFTLAERHQDGTSALEALMDECGAAHSALLPDDSPPLPAAPDDATLTPQTIGAALAALLPEHAIIADEMVSASAPIAACLLHAAPHDRMPVTGGSIGQGLPVALGAACACPDRKVVALEADGSGMYTLQALWTMAREQLDVVTIILANRRYEILEIEMRRVGVDALTDTTRERIDISRPTLDWVRLSEGMGVPASRAHTVGEFKRQFCEALARRGPGLIEAAMS